MKLITKEEADAHQRATVLGGAKGFLGASALTFPAAYTLNKRWAYYRALPPSLKAFSVILFVVPSFVIGAERAGQKFERDHWTGAGKQELELQEEREEERWTALTTKEKVLDAARRHQYSVILGGWSLSMLAAFGFIARNRYQSLPQKVVQARMWAQGLTIGVLIAAGVMTHAQRQKALDEGPIHHNTDHSWRDIIEHEQAATAAATAAAGQRVAVPQRVPRYY